MHRLRANYNSFSEATAAGVRMSFHEHGASCHHSFNSESPLRWLVIGVLDPSRAAPDGISLISSKATRLVAERKTSKSRSVSPESYLLRNSLNL